MDLVSTYSFYGIKLIPNRLAMIDNRTKDTKITIAPIVKTSQKFVFFVISQGIKRNIGKVGSTYQKV